MSKCFRFVIFSALALIGTAARVSADPQTFHIIDINEVYTNADGTKQFVELIAGSDFQTNLAPTWLIALNANGTDTNVVFDFVASFPALNNNETILLATVAMAGDLGFDPDFFIPDNSLFLTNGRVIFEDPPTFPTMVDAVAYGAYTGSNTNFGTPTSALPSDGCRSLRRAIQDFLLPKDNAAQWTIAAAATPRNNAGETITLTCPPTAPALAPIGNKVTNENQLLQFDVSASDLNGDAITLTAENLPSGATFNPLTATSKRFSWTPTFLQSGIYNVFFIASDGALADSENVQITVNEVTDPPTAICQNVQASANASCQASVPASSANNGSTDPEDGTNLSLQLVPLGPYSLGPTPVQLIVTDSDGAEDTCNATITVVDDTDPVIVCPNDTVIGVAPGTTEVAVNYSPQSATDNCGAPTVTSTPPSGSNFPLGVTAVTVIAQDAAGNADTCTFTVTVMEVSCNCPCWADPSCDGVRSDVLDVVGTVNVAFRGFAAVIDPGCPKQRSDVDASSATDVLDVVKVVNVAFRGFSVASQYVDPCL